jgi:hypothetical protein
MPNGSANKVMDVVKAKNGKTIQINNTDAEGRLILADALCYAEKFGAAAIVDLATLTGANHFYFLFWFRIDETTIYRPKLRHLALEFFAQVHNQKLMGFFFFVEIYTRAFSHLSKLNLMFFLEIFV